MNDREIRWLGHVRRLALGPDDVVVLSCHQKISPEGFQRLQKRVLEIFGPDRHVLLLHDGMEIGVIAKAAA